MLANQQRKMPGLGLRPAANARSPSRRGRIAFTKELTARIHASPALAARSTPLSYEE